MHTNRDQHILAFSFVLLFGCGSGSVAGGGTDDGGGNTNGDGGGTADMAVQPLTCADGKKDGDETDVDCGGSCGKCAVGKSCGKAGDCATSVCSGGSCQASSCTDGAKNGSETDVDCGGACPKCSGGKGCAMNTDCVNNTCRAGLCAAGPLMLGMPASFPLGKGPYGITAADFNNDKKLDIAISAYDGLEILLGKGDGTFAAVVNYPSPMMNSIPGDLAVADFNKDGNLDVIWPDFNYNLAYVVLGKGDGTFGAIKTVKVAGGPQTAVIGDFDGDARADVAFGLAVGDAVAVMTGNGDGSFGTPVAYPSGSKNANCVGALDLDGDGKQDLVVGNLNADWKTGNTLGPGSVYTLINKGDGTFKSATKLLDAGSPASLVVRDFNGDGKQDFAFTDFLAQQVVLSLSGHAPASYPSGKNPNGIDAADLNLDGKPDVVISNGQINLVTIFANTGTGTLGMGTTVPLTYPNPGRLTTGDFNGDGKADIALINFNANGMPVLPILMVILNTTM